MSLDQVLQDLRRKALLGDAVALERLEREILKRGDFPRSTVTDAIVHLTTWGYGGLCGVRESLAGATPHRLTTKPESVTCQLCRMRPIPSPSPRLEPKGPS